MIISSNSLTIFKEFEDEIVLPKYTLSINLYVQHLNKIRSMLMHSLQVRKPQIPCSSSHIFYVVNLPFPRQPGVCSSLFDTARISTFGPKINSPFNGIIYKLRIGFQSKLKLVLMLVFKTKIFKNYIINVKI